MMNPPGGISGESISGGIIRNLLKTIPYKKLENELGIVDGEIIEADFEVVN